MRGLLILLAATCSMLTLHAETSWAREATSSERSNLIAATEKFDAAMRGADLDAIPDAMPPRLLEHIANMGNVSVDQLRKSMIDQMQTLLASHQIKSFSLDADEAEYLELPGGEPYALIPTETLIDTKSNTVLAKGKTLGILDEGNWYLVRIDQPQQVKILREVYPVFEAISLPGGTMEVVK